MRIGLFRFAIVPQEVLIVPASNKGNMLRGGFGHAFRRLCCVPECKEARACPVGVTCPYKAVFEASPPPGAESLSKNQDIPRPFVFRAPQTLQTRFEPGQQFEFELVLIGRALDYLPYFVLSFRELAAEGLGLNRAKCHLERVEQLNLSRNKASAPNGEPAVLYTSQDQTLQKVKPSQASEWIQERLENCSTGKDGSVDPRIAIRFVTPTLLKSEGEVIRRPDFHHILKRVRDRINALSTFFGDGPIATDFKELGERAERIRTVSVQTEWVERSRTSSKTKQRHELSGFTGKAFYEGEVIEFLPWLVLGELTHLGKHTAWGNGRMEVCSVNDAS
jgi:hypothetical protein